MNLQVCKKRCGGCPWAASSAAGWLGPHSVETFVNWVQHEVYIPCHLAIRADMPAEELVHAFEKGEVKLCRGALQAMNKSFKSPRNAEFREVRNTVGSDPDYDASNVLSTWEFLEHHSKYTKEGE